MKYWKRLVITTRKFWFCILSCEIICIRELICVKKKLPSGSLLFFKSIFCKSEGLNFNFSKSFFGVFILNRIIINLKNKTISPKNIPYREKKVGEIFSHFWRISHFYPTNFLNASLFPDQFLKSKGLSWVRLLFFQRKVVLLVWDFSNWARRSALLVSLIHRIGCCKYIPSWISQNKKFLYKLIFRDYKIFRRITEGF